MEKMRTILPVIILLAIGVLLAGCGGSGGDRTIPDEHPYWTVLVFMAADNDLESYAIKDMNELESIGSTPDVKVLVQLDRTPGYDSTNGDWTGTRRYYITRDSSSTTINSQLLDDLGERDMADPQELAEFIQWGTQNYPSDHYLLVLWDHGRGWIYRTLETTPQVVKSINRDVTDRSEMSLDDISQALSQSPKIDVVAFDACLMGMTEVAYDLKGYTDFMVASEENVPATGLEYSRLLDSLNESPSMTPELAARSIVDEYTDYYSSLYTGGLTMSAIRLSSIDDLNSAVNGLAQAILNNMGEVRADVRSAQSVTQYYDHGSPSYYSDYKDLYDFASRLTDVTSPEVRTAAESVMSAVEDTVIHERHSAGTVSGSHGISIYIPRPGDTSLLTQYRTISFTESNFWDEFLSSY